MFMVIASHAVAALLGGIFVVCLLRKTLLGYSALMGKIRWYYFHERQRLKLLGDGCQAGRSAQSRIHLLERLFEVVDIDPKDERRK
jgi:hypothetical protein